MKWVVTIQMRGCPKFDWLALWMNSGMQSICLRLNLETHPEEKHETDHPIDWLRASVQEIQEFACNEGAGYVADQLEQMELNAENLGFFAEEARDSGHHEVAEAIEALAAELQHQPARGGQIMDITTLFPSNYLKAADLGGQAKLVTIESVGAEAITEETTKPVVRFVGIEQGMVLNKTNSMLLASHFGKETNNWIGKQIELYPDRVSFQGQIVDALRVRIPVAPAAVPAQPAPATPKTPGDGQQGNTEAAASW